MKDLAYNLSLLQRNPSKQDYLVKVQRGFYDINRYFEQLSPLPKSDANMQKITELTTTYGNLIQEYDMVPTSALFMMGGSRRSSHLAKHKHKNKTKHKHNHNDKARPNRKNKKTIKKYRGMSRMPVMPRMQKQNVVAYRKHKKTTRNIKPPVMQK